MHLTGMKQTETKRVWNSCTPLCCSCFGMMLAALLFLCMMLASCGPQEKNTDGPLVPDSLQENIEAKQMLQGVWLDNETEEVVMKADGDTIYFADDTNQPAYFRIMGDSIELGANSYLITKQTEHNFWFCNPAGDEVQLVKGDSTDLYQAASISEEPRVIATSHVINLDSVVMYGGQRYHWYITVNPTRYRVTRTTYTADGVAVEKVYYDNIIHVSVFKGNQRLFTRDFNKQAYAADVPEDFLVQSILGNIRFDHVDAQGFHFDATVCIPDGESCYMIETLVGFDGNLALNLIEY